MSALRGNLTDFGIAEVFQLIGQQRKTGLLEIEHRGDRVQLLFDGGAVVRAEPATGKEDAALAEMLLRCGLVTRERLLELRQETERSLQRLALLAVERGVVDREQLLQMEDLLTQETLFRVLRWSEGSFAFTASPVHHDRQGRLLAAEQILMDGLRMVDEWRTFASEVPSEETVFQHVGRFEDYQAAHASDGGRLEHAKRVYLLVDGRLPVRRVIDLSRLGTFEVTRILAGLRREGLLEPLDPAQLEKQRPTPQFDLRPPPSRPWIAGALPLVLLLAVAALGQRGARAPLPTDTFPLPRAGLAQAYEAVETQRVRKALEAWHFERGTWPTRLDELVDAGFLPPGALTRPDGRPYYYERRGEQSLLLAPEH